MPDTSDLKKVLEYIESNTSDLEPALSAILEELKKQTRILESINAGIM
jgi:hypothetical protein